MRSGYNHKKIEKKWQKYWQEKKLFVADNHSKKPKFYPLVEFPYPSGDGLHVGHVRSYTAMDIVARKRRCEGYNVLYPIGWDAFGLPTENYAIKTGISPATATKKNTANFRRQLHALGFSFDWEREINTTDPDYYRWTQWIFLQLFKHGLAYKALAAINWCPSCKIGLANEEAVGGHCDRCGGPVEQRQKEQWMLRITAYAEKLLAGLKDVDFLPEIKKQQENWIGRSEGAEIDFRIRNYEFGIRVFTTRPDTLDGVTYLVLSPEHPLVMNNELGIRNYGVVKKYIVQASKKSKLERQESKEKTGVELKGITAINPLNGEELPIWVADYVLAGYGTGAIMAVPRHDERDHEFAKKYHLPIVDRPLLPFDEAVTKSGGPKKVIYKLRDWVFSRQRYWGEPIPLVFCKKCNEWVAVSDDQLPVELPKVKNYQPRDDGQSPLASVKKWVNTKCPKCGGAATRETDVMPNWAGSSWYYIAYAVNEDSRFKIQDSRLLTYWLPVDWYNGGMEHVTLHLLYSRFWNLFLHDIGVVPVSEPYKKRTTHGMILGEGGVKMSKSKGNVVNPDELVEVFGADALRLYEMFIGPFDHAVVWDPRGIVGTRRFLDQVCRIAQEKISDDAALDDELRRLLEQTIKKVSQDIEAMAFNTAVSAMMIFINSCATRAAISPEVWRRFLLILVPFAPHLAEELFHELGIRNPADAKALAGRKELGNKNSIHEESWPVYDPNLVEEEVFDLVVQVNGKTRAVLKAKKGISQVTAEELAKQDPTVSKWLAGEIRKIIFVKDRLINFIV